LKKLSHLAAYVGWLQKKKKEKKKKRHAQVALSIH